MRVRAQDQNGDYTFGQGGQNFLVNSAQAIIQLVVTGLRLFQGEFFLDTSAGMPWMTDVIGTDTQSIYDAAVQAQILGTDGITGIANYSSSLNTKARLLKILCMVDTAYGPIDIATEVPYVPPGSGYGVLPYGQSYGG